MNPLHTIARGDVVRLAPPNGRTPRVPLYQSNGRLGSCFGPWGLHCPPDADPANLHGRTWLCHMRHHVRARFGADYLLPLGQLHWAQEPVVVSHYRQHQSLVEGTVTTRFRADGWSAAVTTWFDPVARDVMGCEIITEGRTPDVCFSPITRVRAHYDQDLTAAVESTAHEGAWRARIKCLNVSTDMVLRTNAPLTPAGERARLTLKPGRTWILIAVGELPANLTPERSLGQTKAWWRTIWSDGLWLDLPDDDAQRLWARSMAYIICSYNDDRLGLPPPTGLSGAAWPFPFPQDVSYIHPVLLAAGPVDVARAWMEHFAERLDGMREYTRRLIGANGVLCPWVMPYGPFHGYHTPAPPNKYYYEVHNSGYLCRMAHETALAVDNPEWTAAVARPLIRETASFYAGICRRGTDGLWHIHHIPSMGQDEYGGENQPDYLCALFSAQYCLQTAARHGLDADGRMQTILNDGLAFAPLRSDGGYYFTCAGAGARDLGRQKHPPQLNPLAFLPVLNAPDAPALNAYRRRTDITMDAKKPFFYGWTLGEFLLAGARVGDAEGWREDWACLRPSDYVDAEGIQVYESSRNFRSPFYTTTHGLLAQAIQETLISTWWGRLDIASGFPWSAPVQFGGLRTLPGLDITGAISPTDYDLTLAARRDICLPGPTGPLQIRKGERMRLAGSLRRP